MKQPAHRSEVPVRALLVMLSALALPIAAAATTVSLPATTTIGEGQTVNISVSADVADGIEGADLRITYDPAIVAPAGDAVSATSSAICMPLTNSSVSGTLQIGLACEGPLSGPETLLTFPLTGLAPGSTTLTLSRCDLNEAAIPCTPVAGVVQVPSPTPTLTATNTATFTQTPTNTPTLTSTPTLTLTASRTATQTRTNTTTPTRTMTRTATATRTATLPPAVHLDPLTSPIVIGAANTLTGSGFTLGSRVLLFVNNGGVQSYGPFAPNSVTATTLTWTPPATIPLGNGFGSVYVVNTDQGFIQSESRSQYLRGAAAANIPTILSINGINLRPLDVTVPVATVDTVVVPGSVVTIGGTGFNAPLVNLFTGAGFVGPLTPQAGGTTSSFQITVPTGTAAGPGTFQVVNSPYSGNVVSNAVSVVLGARLDITQITQSGATVIVDGAGFSALSVINLWNSQSGGTVYFGGYSAPGQPSIPLTLVSSSRFTFTVPPGAVTGLSYLQVVNPPFIPSTTTGADPDGSFIMTVP